MVLVFSVPAHAEGNKWMYAGLIVSDIADMESTFWALKNNPNAREANVLARWHINRGRKVTYPVHLGVDVLMIWLSHKTNSKLPLAILTTSHSVAFVMNIKVGKG